MCIRDSIIQGGTQAVPSAAVFHRDRGGLHLFVFKALGAETAARAPGVMGDDELLHSLRQRPKLPQNLLRVLNGQAVAGRKRVLRVELGRKGDVRPVVKAARRLPAVDVFGVGDPAALQVVHLAAIQHGPVVKRCV